MTKVLELDCSMLPLEIKLKGEAGNHVLFTLKAAGRKLGAQLVRLDRATLQLRNKK